MTDVMWAAVVAAGLVGLAGLVALRTWKVRRTAVRWMRPPGSLVAHAVLKADLAADLDEVQALADCARWHIAFLERNDHVDRCAACDVAAERLDRERR